MLEPQTLVLTKAEVCLILKLREVSKWGHAQVLIEYAHGKITKFWRTIKDDPAQYQ